MVANLIECLAEGEVVDAGTRMAGREGGCKLLQQVVVLDNLAAHGVDRGGLQAQPFPQPCV